MARNLLSTTQAAKIAQRHQRTIVAWIHKGKLAAMKMPGGRGAYVIEEEDLRALLDAMYTPLPYEPDKPTESE